MPSNRRRPTNQQPHESRDFGERRPETKGERRGQPQPKVPGDPNARWRPPTEQSKKNDKKG